MRTMMQSSMTRGGFKITGVRHDLGAPEDFDGHMSWNVDFDDERDGRFKVAARYVASNYDPRWTPNGFGEKISLEVQRDDLISIGGGCIDARNAFLRSAKMEEIGFDVRAGGGPDEHTHGTFFVAGMMRDPEMQEAVRIAGNVSWRARPPGSYGGPEDGDMHWVSMQADNEWRSRSGRNFELAEEVSGNFVGRLAAGVWDARREIAEMVRRKLNNASIWAPPV